MSRLTVLGRVFTGPHPEAAKVPLQITALFWATKLISTAFGEAMADCAFVVALRRQFSATRYSTATYWFAVAMVATFGTMVADVVHQFTGLPYWATTLGYAIVLAVVLLRWHRSEGTLSIHSIDTARRERFYWATVLATFALGTAAGDWTATSLHLDYLPSALLFCALIAVPALAYRLGANPVPTFWTAYILTRPLGASVADWLDNPPASHGLGVPRPVVWGALGLGLVAGVIAIAMHERRSASRLATHPSVVEENEVPT